MKRRPKVGIGVVVKRGNKILLGKRKNAHGAGCWSFPGGHLEYSESLEKCAKREIDEEVGIKITNIRFATITNDFFRKDKRHYITIYMLSEYSSGKVIVKEPHKCERWEWFLWNRLPRPLFISLNNLRKQRFNPFKKMYER